MSPEKGVDGVIEVVELSDAELYEKHADELTRFATVLVGPSDAPDVVSGAVLNCLSSAGWRTASNRRAYLYRAVLNEARSTRRSSARRRVREKAVNGPREMTNTGESSAEIFKAVNRLSVRQRAVVVLTYWSDLDPASIATLLGIGEGSVRRHLARARAHLREYLNEAV